MRFSFSNLFGCGEIQTEPQPMWTIRQPDESAQLAALRSQLAQMRQERAADTKSIQKLSRLRKQDGERYEQLLTENRLLGDRFFAVREKVEPFRYTDHIAADIWPLLDTRPDALLTAAEVERVKGLERVGEAAQCMKSWDHPGHPGKAERAKRILYAALSEEE